MLDNIGKDEYFSDSDLVLATKFFYERVKEKWNYVVLYRGDPYVFINGVYNDGYWVEYRPYCLYREECKPLSILLHDITEQRDKLISELIKIKL